MARVRIELDAKVVEKLKVVLAGLASDAARADREVVDKLMEALGKAEAVEEKLEAPPTGHRSLVALQIK